MLYEQHIPTIEDGAEYRVEFEHRTAWNAIARREPDPTNGNHTLLFLGKTRKQDRQFPLIADSEGHIVVETKPAWGRLIMLKPRDRVLDAEQRKALAAVSDRQREFRAADTGRREAVELARKLGLSWENIARELDLTKQAAWEQFKAPDGA